MSIFSGQRILDRYHQFIALRTNEPGLMMSAAKSVTFSTYAADRITEIHHRVERIRCCVWRDSETSHHNINVAISYVDATDGTEKIHRIQGRRPTRSRAVNETRSILEMYFGRVPEVATLKIERSRERAFPTEN